MEISAGFAIICNNKILLTHPVKANKKKMWGIAKGKIEKNENIKTAAIRETKEEIGIDLSKLLKGLVLTWYEINYTSKTHGVYKKLLYSVLKIENLSVIGLSSEQIEHKKLQKSEVDYAKFYTYDEAKQIIFWRQNVILKWLTKKEISW